MHLSYAISPDRRTLTIHADEAARAELREMGEEIGANHSLWDAFERLIANSELEWVEPAVCGDLTDAPILGILGEEGVKDVTVFLENDGLVETGSDGHNTLARPVLERWGFMSYQLRSPLADLRDKGKAVFTAP